MPAPPELLDLVQRFKRNLDQYKRSSYNETQVRVDYIDPFFELLGWDVHNRQGFAEQYRDVVHEDKVKVGKATKAPDYSFRIGGVRKFFLEAKKPSVDLKSDIAPAFQVRRYAWSAGLPLSILTDFEEFAVYDCRIEPHRHDKSSVARVMYFTFEQYAEAWDEIHEVFAKESILRGSFDRYAESTKKKRGTAEVDDAFLADIEAWREMLARNIALRNREITTRELNQAVQASIDRIIFLRIAEDRGFEPYGQLQALSNGANVYRRLVELFHHADRRYNSGLFHFEEEKGRSGIPDEWTTELAIDDKPLKEIFRRLYYPESPYEFSVLPGSILGQVYERFLGKVIRLTSSHQAKVEEKPEVRKAGGVFYTPEYIARYIVEHTVGKLIAGKSPKQISTVRVLDPACGSGSFLLTAYDFLLDYHLDWYVANDPDKWAARKNPPIYRTASSDPDFPVAWKLTTAEKKRVLLNNLYGVDIDTQAVEVTKLSLLLRVLEDEDEQSVGAQISFAERVLPDLSDNIKCGNSLVGPEFYHDEQHSSLDEDTVYRINAFDWRAEFAEVMKEGGFSAVIGNPPYIRIQHMKEWAPLEVEFYKTAYCSAGKGNYDIYVVFVEKGLDLLKPDGLLGYILPHKFFNAKYGEPLREVISEGKHLHKAVHFGDAQVFSGATTYTCLLFLSNQANTELDFEKVGDLETWRLRQELGEQAEERDAATVGQIPAADISANEWNFIVGPGRDLFRKLSDMPVKLGDVADIFVGLQTSADDVFILDYMSQESGLLTLQSQALKSEVKLEEELLRPVISGTDVKRYSPLPIRQMILFPYQVEKEQANLLRFEVIESDYPLTAKYLRSNRPRLSSRERGKFDDAHWYRFGRRQNLGIQGRRKLCIPRLVETLHAGLDSDGRFYLDNVDVGGVTLSQDYHNWDLRFLQGLLDSSLFGWYFPNISAPFRGGWYSANKQFVSQLPIRTIDFTNAEDVSRHDQMVRLVESMLDLHKRCAAAKTGHDKNMLTRQIESTDTQINRLVYELYELSAEEIAIVEGRI